MFMSSVANNTKYFVIKFHSNSNRLRENKNQNSYTHIADRLGILAEILNFKTIGL